MTSDIVKALPEGEVQQWNTHSNRHGAGFMNPHMVMLLSTACATCPPYSPLRLDHSLMSCLPVSKRQQITHWLFAAGRLGVCDPTEAGHSQESIGSAVVLLEGLEIITGSVLKWSFTIMNIIKHLNYLYTKWSSWFRSVLMVGCQIRTQTTNKWSSTILAALRPFGDTMGALRGGCKCSQKDLHFTITARALPLPL